MATPYSVTVLESVASTQDLARDRFDGEGVPAVVVAHRQHAGRGRSGASWRTAPRAVAVSVAFRPAALVPEVIPLVAGVAARRVLGDRVSLKWPNDVLRGDDKVAGILVEGHPDPSGSPVVVAGMGVNLHWPTPPEGMAGLMDHDPGPEAGPRLARAWAEELLGFDDRNDWPHGEYTEASATLGRDITWEPSGAGRAVDVAADGALIVIDGEGVERHLRSGAVRHVRSR